MSGRPAHPDPPDAPLRGAKGNPGPSTGGAAATDGRPRILAVARANGPALPSATSVARGARRRGWLVRRLLVLADASGLSLAFLLAIAIFDTRVGPTDAVPRSQEILLFVLTLPGWLLLARLHGLYDRDEERTSHSTLDDLVGVFHLVTVGTFLFFAGSWLTGVTDPYPPKLLTFWALAIGFVATARVGARAFARTRQAYVQRTLIVGADQAGRLIARKILDHPEFGIDLVGFADATLDPGTTVMGDLAVLGSPEELPELVRELDVGRIVVGFFARPVDEAIDLVRWAKDLQVQIDIVPRLFATVDPRAQIHMLEGFPLIGVPPARLWRSSLSIKYALDIVLAAISVVVLAPVLLAIAIAIRLESKGPALYRHERVGMNGRPFRLTKFRTMYLEYCSGAGYGGNAAADELERLLERDAGAREEYERAQKLADDPRVTRLGRFLRRTSLDELPQLLNVLRGDMSLVGPRPVTVQELARYGDEVDKFLSFRPGVTGYWQINGRSRTAYDERVRLDLAYIRGWSLKLDLTILGKTLWTLVKGHGAY